MNNCPSITNGSRIQKIQDPNPIQNITPNNRPKEERVLWKPSVKSPPLIGPPQRSRTWGSDTNPNLMTPGDSLSSTSSSFFSSFTLARCSFSSPPLDLFSPFLGFWDTLHWEALCVSEGFLGFRTSSILPRFYSEAGFDVFGLWFLFGFWVVWRNAGCPCEIFWGEVGLSGFFFWFFCCLICKWCFFFFFVVKFLWFLRGFVFSLVVVCFWGYVMMFSFYYGVIQTWISYWIFVFEVI